MALNNLGLGFTISATDAASSVFRGITARIRETIDAAKEAGGAGGAGGLASRILGSADSLSAASALLTAAGAGLSAAGGAAKDVGGVFMDTGAGVLSALNDATVVSAAFNKQMAQVATIVDESKVSLDEVREAVMRTGQAFGGKMTEQAKAMYEGFSSGATTAAEGAALLTAANKLAVGGNTSAFKSLQLLTNTLNSYGMAFTQGNLANVSDAMFVAIRDGTVTAEQLAGSLGRVSPIASMAGVSIDELLGSMASITKGGLSAREAATGMRAALINVLRPTGTARKEAARLGIEFNLQALRSKGLVGFLRMITTSAGYNEESIIRLFRSYTGLTDILKLVSKGGDDYAQIMAHMLTKTGQTDQAVQKMSAELQFQTDLFDTLKEQADIVVGTALEPLKIAFYELVNGALKTFINMPAPVRDGLVMVAVALGALAVAAGVAFVVFGTFLAVMGSVLMFVGGLIATVLAAAAAWFIFDLTLAGVAVTGGWLLLAMVALAAIMVWMALAAGAAIAGLYVAWTNNVGGIADKTKAFVDNVKVIYDTVSMLLSSGGMLTGDVRSAFEGAPKAVQDAAISIYVWVSRIKGFFVGIFDGFQAGIAAAQPTIDSFAYAWERLMGAITPALDAPDKAKEKYSAFAAIGEYAGGVFARMFEFVMNVVNGIINFTTGMLKGWSDLGTGIEQTTGIFGGLMDAITELFSALTGSSNATTEATSGWESFGRMIGWVAGIIAQALGAITSVVSAAISILAGVLAAIVDVIVGVWHIIVDVVMAIWSLLTGEWGAAWQYAKNVVADVVVTIMNFVMDMVIGIAKAIDKLGGLFGKDLQIGAQIEGSWQKARGELGGTIGDKSEAVTPTMPEKSAKPPELSEMKSAFFASGGKSATPTKPGMLDQMKASMSGLAMPTAGTAPGVAQAQAQGAMFGAAAKPAPLPPVTVNTRTTLVLDGEQIAQSVTTAQKRLGLLEGLPAE